MKKGDLNAGDLLIDFQTGYAREFLVIQEDNELFLESGTTRRRVDDGDLPGHQLLITSNDRTE